MTLDRDAILARARAAKEPALAADIEALVARVLDLQQDLTDALEHAERSIQCQVHHGDRRLIATLPEPPHGTVRVTASVPVAYDVSPAQMSTYLKARGWVRKGLELPEIEYWYNADGIECAVPMDLRFRDWHRRAAEALNTLAAVECRSTGEILRDIAAMEEA